MLQHYSERELHTFNEARKLAAEGEEFSHLIAMLGPDTAMRLRIFVQDLPESIRIKTIYGRANAPKYTKKK
jgi:hypothetical protein